MLDSGTSPAPRDVPAYDGVRPLRLVWSGVHIGRKAMPILLHALAPLRERPIEVIALGQGPQTEAWDTLAEQLGVRHMIRWMGKLRLPDALAQMRQSDALVFTSLMEAASHVTLEAISMGLPVLCHDACGMCIAVNEFCGIKVPLVDADTSIRGFSEAIRRILDEPTLLRRLADGAAKRATELTWDAKAREIATEYDRILATTSKAADATTAHHATAGGSA
jgi:glycosyltransferase involved in cell wall biosynthesis